MPHPLLLTASLLMTLTVLLLPDFAAAQRAGFGGTGSGQVVSVGYYLVDFEFNGDEEPAFLFDFDQPVYGIAYSRPNLFVTFGLGNQSADDNHENLRLIDLSLTVWGEVYVFGEGRSSTRVFVPIVLYSNYRRVSAQANQSEALDNFNVTVFGLGGGLGLGHSFSQTVMLQARAQPIFGLASSAFADAFGTSYLFDGDVQLHLAQLFGHVGLSLGYTYRWQVWNVNTSNIFPEEANDFFDYRGQQHLFRIGLNF